MRSPNYRDAVVRTRGVLFGVLLAVVAQMGQGSAEGAKIFCPNLIGANAVDLSSPVDDTFLRAAKRAGLRTIIRYYDYLPGETIRGKTIRRWERDKISAAGLKLAVVFQHWNNKLGSFTSERGTGDAYRALQIANEISQPAGSVIYFGVDGGWGGVEDIERIDSYFNSVNSALRESGFKVGAYGSGRVCSHLLKSELVRVCWLANAKGWPDYTKFRESGRWSMLQALPSDCGGIRGVDLDYINKDRPDFGQF